MSLFEYLDIGVIEHINYFLKNPLDSINFIKTIDQYFTHQQYYHHMLHKMLILSTDKILEYHKNDKMCDNCEMLNNNHISCLVCEKTLCDGCFYDKTEIRVVVEKYDWGAFCVNKKIKICRKCFLDFFANDCLQCTICSKPFHIMPFNYMYILPNLDSIIRFECNNPCGCFKIPKKRNIIGLDRFTVKNQ
jgi:hypothetical protein